VASDNIDVPIDETESARVTAPLPVIGLGEARRLGAKWALLARAQGFSVEFDDIDGSITHGALCRNVGPFWTLHLV
jgi:hypothetical protein